MAPQFLDHLTHLNDTLNELSYHTLAKYAIICTLSFGVSYVLIKKLLIALECKEIQKLREKQTAAAKLATTKWGSDAVTRVADLKLNAESVTSLSYNELKEALKSKKLTATTVLTAFQFVAAKQNAKYNFITEPIPNAMELAEGLDQLSDNDRQSLPLFGIPVSVKENLDIAGMYSTSGLSCKLLALSPADSGVVQTLKKLGAIPFIRTNVPQSLMALGCHNPIYGETRNPLDETRTPGGSSGGESAAVGSGASILGLGSDIGGSIRVPAAWTGSVGLKPTVGRFSGSGITKPIIGQNIVFGTSGFLAQEMSALVDGHRYFSSSAQYMLDPTLARIPFDEEMLSSTKPLTIAYCTHIDPVRATESVTQTINLVAKKLMEQGHIVVPWKPPQTNLNPWQIYLHALCGDARQQLREHLIADEVSYLLASMVRIMFAPQWLKAMLFCFIKPIIQCVELTTSCSAQVPSFVHDFISCLYGVSSVNDWWRLQGAASKYRSEVIQDWQSKGIDVLLCPAVPSPPPKCGSSTATQVGLVYAWIFNLLNFPAGVVPVVKLTPRDVNIDLEKYQGTDEFHSAVKQTIHGSEGLPVSVQVVCLPYRDEQCLRVMKQIESFGSWRNTTLTSI